MQSAAAVCRLSEDELEESAVRAVESSTGAVSTNCVRRVGRVSLGPVMLRPGSQLGPVQIRRARSAARLQ